jgi:hypothetical protein
MAASQPWIAKDGPVWIADAHRGDGQRFVVHADEKLTAFLELEATIRPLARRVSILCVLPGFQSALGTDRKDRSHQMDRWRECGRL